MFHGCLLIAFLPLVPASAQPNDYRLRVQSVQYDDFVLNGKKQQKKTVLWQMQIRIRRDVPFQLEVVIGDRELLLKGKLTDGEKGKHRVRIHSKDNKLTGQNVPVKHGRWQRIKDTTSVTISALELQVGDEMSLAGTVVHDGTKSTKSEIRVMLLPVPTKSPPKERRRGPGRINTNARLGSSEPE